MVLKPESPQELRSPSQCKTTNTIIDVTTDRSICSNAGTLLVADTATTLGITEVLDEHLAGLTPDTVTHTASTVLTSLAVALTAGATCLDDLELLRPLVNTGLTRPIGSVTTAHRRVHQLAESADKVDIALAKAMRTIRTRAWNALGPLNPTKIATREDPLIIDIDASLIHIHSTKQDSAPTYKGGYSFHPLCAFLDHGPGLGGEPLALLMRPGNAGANNADGHITLIKSAYRPCPDPNVVATSATKSSCAPAAPAERRTSPPTCTPAASPTPWASGS